MLTGPRPDMRLWSLCRARHGPRGLDYLCAHYGKNDALREHRAYYHMLGMLEVRIGCLSVEDLRGETVWWLLHRTKPRSKSRLQIRAAVLGSTVELVDSSEYRCKAADATTLVAREAETLTPFVLLLLCHVQSRCHGIGRDSWTRHDPHVTGPFCKERFGIKAVRTPS